MLRIQSVKFLVAVVQIPSNYSISGVTREQLIRIRNDQKQLFGQIVNRNLKESTKICKLLENEPIVNGTADLKALVPSQMCEFYWLVQRCNKKYIAIFQAENVS